MRNILITLLLLLCVSLETKGYHQPLNDQAKYKANLETCLQGYHPYLCRHNILTSEDTKLVKHAEYKANLETCLQGYHPYLCRHNILTSEDTKLVKHAEYKANLENCLQGYHPYLCRHNILTSEDTKLVKHAEYKANAFNKKQKNYSTYSKVQAKNLPKYSVDKKYDEIKTYNRCAENNSCYGDISATTGRPKTTHVKGYYRRNGTYVRGHYRSK